MKAAFPQVVLVLCLSFSLLCFASCNQSSQNQHLVKQRLDELGNGLNMARSQIADLELEIEVLTNQLKDLAGKKVQVAGADPALISDLTERLQTLESRNAELEKSLSSFEKKLGEGAAESQKPLHLPAVLKSGEAPAAAAKAEKIAAAAAPPAPPAVNTRSETPSGIYYTVKQGDTLQTIASVHNVPEARLRQINRIPPGKNPLRQQQIWIPR